ncbi:MAG TPA: aminotransferase class V-fold PLP-dependent enzyme, partial [Candidatus Polarisedimenticolia bacterium]|nr:aminotransferase class V-fold PLP-dependent enzyme [Candidatus Polarisedimenticolia bacterium]
GGPHRERRHPPPLSTRFLRRDPVKPKTLDPAYLRQQIVGIDAAFATPFGKRLMIYCDYTASGRCLRFVETYLQSIQRVYANTHTEDDISGRSMTRLLHAAEGAIKRSVNAGPRGRIVACGTGATGAIDKLQQIIGVALAPATRLNIERIVDASPLDSSAFHAAIEARRPVVFVGPYEHHSNELSWRQSLAKTIEVRMDANGHLDIGHLEELLQDPAYMNRLRVGSFSAASNVTGLRTDVRRVSSLLHRYGALACFDFAACAPYVKIDMNPEPQGDGDDPSIDAIYVSPHKFLGGPGASGVLVFNERIYHRELPPSVSAGGTVDYVGMTGQDYVHGIEEREKAGTPGVLQTMKAGLAFEIKDRVGADVICAREHELTARAMGRWSADPGIEILGDPDPAHRVGIISFNIRHTRGRYLHHKFVTALLNDLFGIQSRAGCSCAGPYGHRLLGIDVPTSERYRDVVRHGQCGMKPGWCRIGLHWVMDDAEADFVIDAVLFVARHGHSFLPLYRFDIGSGSWSHRNDPVELPEWSLDQALRGEHAEPACLSLAERTEFYEHCMDEARSWARRLEAATAASTSLEGELGELQFFELPASPDEGSGTPR